MNGQAPIPSPTDSTVIKEPEFRYYQSSKSENVDMRRLLSNPNALKEYLREEEGT